MTYRPDIDGLRAIAVLSVLMYHLEPSWLPGGYVGVDVFFVISGFLITGLIKQELDQTGQFQFGRFYLRRARRLLPAFGVTLFVSFVSAAVLMTPNYLIEFGQSVIYAALSVSNIFFWSIAGYFDSQSHLKPLLHTWSLGIEEQFYLLWPVIFVLCFAVNKRWLAPAILLLLLTLSLSANVYFFSEQESIQHWLGGLQANNAAPYTDVSSTAFYLLPFRVYELGLGAIIVWLMPYRKRMSFGSAWMFVIGLSMIVVAFFSYNDQTEFPSYHALLPCLGAAMIILSGPKHAFQGLLNNRLMVGIGLISYSLYLIHWPIIVFYRFWRGEALHDSELFLLGMVSIVIAAGMYFWVEKPFRKVQKNPQHNNRKFVVGAVVLLLVFVSLGLNVERSGGWLWRYSKNVVEQLTLEHGDYQKVIWRQLLAKQSRRFSDHDKLKAVVIGDSMAGDFTNVLLATMGEQNVDLVTIPILHNCKAILGMDDEAYRLRFGSKQALCQKEHQKMIDHTQLLLQADVVFLASYWWEAHWLPYIEKTIQHMNAQGVKQLVVVGLKNQDMTGRKFQSKYKYDRDNYKIRTKWHPHTWIMNDRIRHLSGDFFFFDQLPYFCEEDMCQRTTREGYLIIVDAQHLSRQGVVFLADKIRQKGTLHRLLGMEP